MTTPATAHRLDRVHDEVREGLLDLRGVDVDDGRRTRRRASSSATSAFFGERREELERLARELARGRAARLLGRPRPGEVEELADDPRHALRLLDDDRARSRRASSADALAARDHLRARRRSR